MSTIPLVCRNEAIGRSFGHGQVAWDPKDGGGDIAKPMTALLSHIHGAWCVAVWSYMELKMSMQSQRRIVSACSEVVQPRLLDVLSTQVGINFALERFLGAFCTSCCVFPRLLTFSSHLGPLADRF